MKNKVNWKKYKVTLSEYIDHFEEPWLTGWITKWRYNQTKTHIEDLNIPRLLVEFQEHRFWAFASDLNKGTIVPVMIKQVRDFTMEEIKAQYDINMQVDFMKYSPRQEALKNINKDFE